MASGICSYQCNIKYYMWKMISKLSVNSGLDLGVGHTGWNNGPCFIPRQKTQVQVTLGQITGRLSGADKLAERTMLKRSVYYKPKQRNMCMSKAQGTIRHESHNGWSHLADSIQGGGVADQQRSVGAAARCSRKERGENQRRTAAWQQTIYRLLADFTLTSFGSV